MRSLALYIGFRYSADRSGNQLVSFLSRLSMLGLILGVALLVVVLSVMNGFDREMRNRILALVPHITLQPWSSQQLDWQSLQKDVEQHPDVFATAPFVQGNAMLIKAGEVEPSVFFGIDPVSEKSVSRIQEYVDLDILQPNTPDIILGKALAERLKLSAGDKVTLGVPQEKGQQNIRFLQMTVAAIVETGTELDQQLVLMHISMANSLFEKPLPVSMRVSVNDVFAAPQIGWELASVHGQDYLLKDWSQQFGNMYHAIQMSRKLVVIMLLAVVAVAVFNIISTLVMVVNDKRADIGILRSQGASQRDILRIFLSYGALIGAVGASAGGVIGVILAYGVSDLVAGIESLFGLQLLQSDVYPINYLPSDVRLPDVLLVCLTAYGMSLLATLYPAWRASRIPPAEALRSN
ncbi:Lipoprotein-releasing system transmembrane protein LolE [Zhongshania aliphaticivorans]|uniref:Lipoprotein-releasing system transmembrane protein LolE n=1 Tax=Zhongshania aliphaticivorans TaxID=1470434 RepID=A0A5S9QF23_9GAMM|nr:lipoprotein-releasing ABC transporter permease subunit [Zhongshania aliphaticivorans]CAA0088390.1 Lipoprotein-releasing system transmembrane protein LolE [Zhongshania aliphaticivorans]CAA0116444.1 Lipoprotein-releasing system transmembrane protein LolE [Zhongshania aliphaticivorans]CAA0120483.1 Lipoprotein-releasing system transmembrane protein LolE [Zhongshania aliphaticivorans]